MAVIIDFEAARARRAPTPLRDDQKPLIEIRAMREMPGKILLSISRLGPGVPVYEIVSSPDTIRRLIAFAAEATLQADWLASQKPPDPPPSAA